MTISSLIAAALLSAFAQDEGGAASEPSGPVVVELFTSQGCPHCPAANATFGEIAAREGVIAIGYGVDHWDTFGWDDIYAKPEFNDRQSAYVEAGEANRVFTPQFVVNGGPEKYSHERGAIADHVAAAEPLEDAQAGLAREDDSLIVTIDGPERETPAEVWLIAYEPGERLFAPESGRNAGLEIEHHNMAIGVDRLPDWPGGAYREESPAPERGIGSAVLVQAERGGRLLAAADIKD